MRPFIVPNQGVRCKRKEFQWQKETQKATAISGAERIETYEARFTYTDELGQPQRGSVYAKTQKECRKKLTAILKQIDEGSYRKTGKRYTVAEWFEEWIDTYCKNLKARTVDDYRGKSKRYIIPNLGKVQLAALTPMQVQKFCN